MLNSSIKKLLLTASFSLFIGCGTSEKTKSELSDDSVETPSQSLIINEMTQMWCGFGYDGFKVVHISSLNWLTLGVGDQTAITVDAGWSEKQGVFEKVFQDENETHTVRIRLDGNKQISQAEHKQELVGKDIRVE